MEHMRQWMGSLGITNFQGADILRQVRMVATAYDTVLTARMQDVRLTPQRWWVLMRMLAEEEHGGGSINPTQLSRAHNLSKNTISAHLRALEDAGLIERALDHDDRRQFNMHLTQAGRELVRAATPDHIELLNNLVADLEDEERRELVVLLHKLHLSILRRSSPEALGAAAEGF